MGLVTGCSLGTNFGCGDCVGQALIGWYVMVDIEGFLGIVGVELTRYAQPR